MQQSQFTTPQEALTPIIGGGAQMVYEFRWALQQIRENAGGGLDQQQLLEVMDPLTRGLGWIERDVFGQATDVTSVLASGGQQGRS